MEPTIRPNVSVRRHLALILFASSAACRADPDGTLEPDRSVDTPTSHASAGDAVDEPAPSVEIARSVESAPGWITGHHERRMGSTVDGQRLHYRVDVPAGDAPEGGWPLLLFLHGIGESGDDLALLGVHGPTKHLDEFPELRSCVFVAPQCPENSWWQSTTLKALLDEVRGIAHVDDSRLYVTGLSMGGFGTWNLLASYPELFAAAVPICGGGEVGPPFLEGGNGFELANLLLAKETPVRAYHGSADTVVPARLSKALVSALEAVDADVELTIYPGVGHDSWTRTYANPRLYSWMFAQRR